VDDKTTYAEFEWADEAYDGRIQYTDSNRIVVLYDGEFYTFGDNKNERAAYEYYKLIRGISEKDKK
jgi:hypothetical protein